MRQTNERRRSPDEPWTTKWKGHLTSHRGADHRMFRLSLAESGAEMPRRVYGVRHTTATKRSAVVPYRARVSTTGCARIQRLSIV